MTKIEEILKKTTNKTVDKTNWSDAWSREYPILRRYKEEMNVHEYQQEIRKLLEEIKTRYHYSDLDAMLVLKDILYQEWKDSKK